MRGIRRIGYGLVVLVVLAGIAGEALLPAGRVWAEDTTVAITVRIPVTYYQWGQVGSHQEYRQIGARWEWRRTGTQREWAQVGARWERRRRTVQYFPGWSGAWIWQRTGTSYEWRKVAEHLEWRHVRTDRQQRQVGVRDEWALLGYQQVYRPHALARAYGQVGTHGRWTLQGQSLVWQAAGSHAEQRYAGIWYQEALYDYTEHILDWWPGAPSCTWPFCTEQWTQPFFDHRIREGWWEIWSSGFCFVAYAQENYWWSMVQTVHGGVGVADAAPARTNAYAYGTGADYGQVTVQGDYATVPVFGFRQVPVYDWVDVPVYQWVTVEDWDWIFVPVYGWVWHDRVNFASVDEEWWEWVPVYGWRETPVYTLTQVPEHGWVTVPDYGWTPVTVWEERQVLVDRSAFPGFTLGVNPERGLTGLESYFWIDGDARGAFERTVQVAGLDPYQQGPVTVRLRFVPVRYDWSFGDGGTASVTSPGWPYDPLSGIQSDVRHTYERTSRAQPGGRYEVRVTAVYDVYYSQDGGPWRYAGRATGSGSRAYEVQQLQAVLE